MRNLKIIYLKKECTLISKISRSQICEMCKNNSFSLRKLFSSLISVYSFGIKIKMKYVFIILFLNVFFNETYAEISDNDYFASAPIPLNGQKGLNNGSASLILSLLDAIGAKAIIENPFFLHTNSLVYRIVQDLPFFNDSWAVKRRYVVPTSLIGITPFYTHMSHAIFHYNGDDLKDYLALDDSTILSTIRTVSDSLKQFNDQFYLEPDKIFNALKNGSVEQRRAGLLISWERRLGEWSLSGSVPLYYVERNYQLSKKAKRSLEKELGASTVEEQNTFQKNHLISDRFGVGDLRIKIALPIVESWKEHFEAVMLVTVPLGGSFITGLAGNSFTGSSTVPVLDLNDLVEMIIQGKQEEAFTVLNTLGLDALDRLSATLLEQSLPNGRHFSIGLGCVNKVKLKDFFINNSLLRRWHWNYTCTAEYVIPAKDRRSFINKIDKGLIEGLDFSNPIDPDKTLEIFTQEALDRFFLRSFKAKVHPGFLVRSYSTFVYKHEKWQAWLGTDFWFKSAEKVVFLDTTSAVQQDLDRRKVENSHGLALSSLIGASYAYQTYLCTVNVGLDMYSTYCTRGIGKEFGIALRIITYF